MKAVLPLLCLLLASGLKADEVHLKNGQVLVGKVHISGRSMIIDTRAGTVRVTTDQVLRIRSESELRSELAGLARRDDAGSLHVQFALARKARGYGLGPEMWHHLSLALELAGQRETMPPMLSRFLADLEPEILPSSLRAARVSTRVRELLSRIRPRTGFAQKAAVHEILAQMPGASTALRKRARRASSSMQRSAALRAIAARSEPGSRAFVYRGAILDRRADVRREIMRMVAAGGHGKEAVDYLAPGLTIGSSQVRTRTAQAMVALGDNSAIDYLVAAGPIIAAASPSRAGVRAHMAVTRQQSYIRDFDVEIAQSAFIANPKIGILQSGVVLDVTVLGVSSVRVQVIDTYRRALVALSHDDPGPRTEDWSRWLAHLRRN